MPCFIDAMGSMCIGSSILGHLPNGDTLPHIGCQSCLLQVQFREAITRMETLSEEEAKDNASAIKDLRDKAMLAKGRWALIMSNGFLLIPPII